jgi:hypothetical protein
MVRQVNAQSQEIKDTLRALRRAARKALELGLKTGTPVYVFRDNKIVDITKDPPRQKSRSTRKTRQKVVGAALRGRPSTD